MKKILYSFAGSLCLCALAGACSDDETAETGPGREVAATLEATLPAGGAGRVVFADGALAWQPGDSIGLWLGKENADLPFALREGSVSDDGRTARFDGYIGEGIEGDVEALAYYPYRKDASMTQNSVVTEFPGMQPYDPAGYGPVPLIGRYEGNYQLMRFGMRSPYAVIRLQVAKAPSETGPVRLRQIVFHGNSGEGVSGRVTMTLTQTTDEMGETAETVGLSFASDAGKTVILDCGEGVELTTEPQVFRMMVPALRYAKGYTFDFRTDREGADAVVLTVTDEEGVELAGGQTYDVQTVLENFGYTIPDANFRDWLVAQRYVKVTDEGAGTVTITAAGAEAQEFYCRGMEIGSLEGIGYFPALVTLDCAYNRLTSLALQRNPALVNLYCNNNRLASLDVSANTVLDRLYCQSNLLSTLDVTHNAALTALYCNANRLSELNVAQNPVLAALYCYSNLLSTLDASHMAAPDRYLLYCGRQGVEPLQLTLAAAQQPRWEAALAGAEANVGVELVP